MGHCTNCQSEAGWLSMQGQPALRNAKYSDALWGDEAEQRRGELPGRVKLGVEVSAQKECEGRRRCSLRRICTRRVCLGALGSCAVLLTTQRLELGGQPAGQRRTGWTSQIKTQP